MRSRPGPVVSTMKRGFRKLLCARFNQPMREKGARAVVVLYLRPCPEPEHCPREVFLLHDGHPGGVEHKLKTSFGT